MRKITIYYFIILTALISNVLLAQNLPKIIPPSPNATSLGQYADIPVSNYTGVPNISIPLYNIKSGQIELPITLSYHASGIKVSQEASWVGLGWALNAGGLITRQVRGLDDFRPFRGIISNPIPVPANNPDNFMNFWEVYNQYQHPFEKINDGRFDGEPDIFYYNFLGQSGKLIFKPQPNATELIATPVNQSNLIIKYAKNEKKWTIIDGNGWKYIFGSNNLKAIEKTTNYSFSRSNPPITEDRIVGFDDSNPYDTETAWYLTKIISPEGDEVEFIYENRNPITNDEYLSLSQVNRSETLNAVIAVTPITQIGGNNILDNILDTFNPPDQPFYTRLYIANQQRVRNTYLKKIIFNNGVIDFYLKDRQDIRQFDFQSQGSPLKHLEYFEIKDLNNKLIKKVNFTHTYFLSSGYNDDNLENFKRLKLDNVQEIYQSNSGLVSKPAYNFAYNSYNLPKKTSFSIDHYGYFNSKQNTRIKTSNFSFLDLSLFATPFNLFGTEGNPLLYNRQSLIPNYESDLNLNDVEIRWGADREVDISGASAKANILEKIEYPTGGTLEFTYELNDYSSDLPLYENIKTNVSAQYYGAFGIYGDNIEIEDFSLDAPTVVFLDFNIRNSVNNVFDGQALLKIKNGDELVKINNFTVYGNKFAERSSLISIVLPAGDYQLVASGGSKSNVNDEVFKDVLIRASYTRKVLTSKKKGAGVRVQSIKTKDKNNFVKNKLFLYEKQGVSTGILMSPVSYYYKSILTANTNHTVQTYQYLYLNGVSNSIFSLGSSAQGNPIGYSQVINRDLDSEGNNNGESEYFYKNEKEIVPQYFIPGLPNFTNLNNGQLNEEKRYNNNENLIYRKQISYSTHGNINEKVKGVKSHKVLNRQIFEFDPNYGDRYEAYYYDIFTEFSRPSTETTIIFDRNGNNPITTRTEYEYSNPIHKNITSTTTTNSKGEVMETNLEYPSDYPTNTGINISTLNKMVSKNIINPVIKQEIILGSSISSTQINLYKNWDVDGDGASKDSDDIILPETIQTSKGSGNLEDRITYHKYDNKGNPIEVSKAKGTHTYYIWGYNKQYPLAKIDNFTSAQAEVIKTLIIAAETASNTDNDRTQGNTGKEGALRYALNAIRNHTALSKAMISTYTYDPLIGVTSVTDPKGYTMYYEYDAFNRLKHVKDANGKLLSENQYNYKN